MTKTTSDLMTLAERNEDAAQNRREWNGLILERRAAVGQVGHRRSGDKAHYLSTDVIVGYAEGFTPKPGRQQIGSVLSAYGYCNGNGQHVGRVLSNLDIKDVNCGKCLKGLGINPETQSAAQKAAKAEKDAQYEAQQAVARQRAAETKVILAHSAEINAAMDAIRTLRDAAATPEQSERLTALLGHMTDVIYTR